MLRKNRTGKIVGTIFGLGLAMSGPLHAQGVQPAAPPALGNSPKVEALLGQTKRAAGKQWSTAYEFLCKADGSTANNANDPVIEPVRLFDNLYAVGRTSTVVYALTTSDGIILIDAGYRDDVETVLLPGLKKVGLDPAQIKGVIVAHGHADHFGGAAFLQERYASKVYLSSEDWTVATTPPRAPPGVTLPANPVIPPRPDMTIVSERPITQGNTQIMPVLIPGHTPGAVGLIFPVTDGGRQHVAALFGGTILIHTRIPDEGLRRYSASVKHFGEVTRKMGVDVELQNHPMYDDMAAKLAKLTTRAARAPNPFVVGKDGYQNFLRVMSGCAEVQLERRAAAK